MSSFVRSWSVFIALGLLSASGSCGFLRPAGRAGVELTVDTALGLSARMVPGPPGAEHRPVAAVQDERGALTEFVENELLFPTADADEVRALLGRYPGKVLRRIDLPAKDGRPRAIHVVQIDTSAVKPVDPGPSWSAVSPRSRGGRFKVSSQAALNLLGVIAQERIAGRKLRPNFLERDTSFFDGSLESSAAPAGPDATTWPELKAGGVFDYDVSGAWKALECAGKLPNKVKIAILDQGFTLETGDLPLVTEISKGGFTSSANFHGTRVAMAAAGRTDNGFGAAGPAGPVGTVALLERGSGEDGLIAGLMAARSVGARIVNMSFQGKVSQSLFYDEPDESEDLTRQMWNEGTLLFASAGNDGEDIDARDGDSELYWHWPCENQGVICVGGIAGTKPERHPRSNYGEGRGETVDISAPYEVLVGPDLSTSGNVTQLFRGTSASSPFAAGVAALIWAANPSLTNVQVWDLMRKHARGSPLRVHASGAVREALSADKPAPCIVRMDPDFGADLQVTQSSLNVASPFRVELFSPAAPCCDVTWTSSVDGVIGKGDTIQFLFAGKPAGKRAVTMTAMADNGRTVSRHFMVTVKNTPPAIQWLEPSPASPALTRGLGVVFRAKVTDDLPVDDSRCVWSSNRPGEGPWKGCQTLIAFQSDGPRQLAITYTDAQGESATAHRLLSVAAPLASGPPQVELLVKSVDGVPGSTGTKGNTIAKFSFLDPGGPGEADRSKYSYQWELEFGGNKTSFTPKHFLGRPDEIILESRSLVAFPECGNGPLTLGLKLTITDPEKLVGAATASYSVYQIACIH